MSRIGLALFLGLLLIGVFLFASWVRMLHQPAPLWQTSLNRTLEEIDGFPPAERLCR